MPFFSRTLWLALPVLIAGSGCRSLVPNAASKTPSPTTASAPPVTTDDYLVMFPDVIEITAADRPDWSGRFLVNPEGRIEITPGGMLVESKTVPQIRGEIAAMLGLDPHQVTGRVVQHRSRSVHVFGLVNGEPRSLPYGGPERVGDLLTRAGGVTGKADRGKIVLVRRRVASGEEPESLQVDWDSIRSGDQRTNHRLLPGDEIHIGPSRLAQAMELLP